MGWQRRGQSCFYTQTLRRDGHFERVYVGRGPLAELASQADGLLQAERATVAKARQDEQACWQAALEPLEHLDKLTQMLTRAALLAAGFHEYRKGKWRRRRDRNIIRGQFERA